jgi:solute carrier family 9B (sodium/hydrogen exchanger), member 1/2
VQAALASTPLDLIIEFKKDALDYSEWQQWGKDIITTAVFSIVVTAPIGLIFITWFGDKVGRRPALPCANVLASCVQR